MLAALLVRQEAGSRVGLCVSGSLDLRTLGFRAQANLEYRQLLNNVQKDTLLGYINRLMDTAVFS
jgi:hypothetical protein